MKKRINVGVVGCGYWGPNLIRNLNSLPGCRLRAVCDLDMARLDHMKSLYPDVELFTDFDRFLHTGRLDAVVIATAVSLHWPMAKASLEAGKHTFVEKPMATRPEHCLALTELADRKGLVLMAGHTFLYSPVVRRVKKIIDQGDLGEIRYISTRRLNLGLFQKDINVAWDLAPHDISIILYIMGEMPLGVNCQGNTALSSSVHAVTSMWLTFSKNRSAIIQSSWLDPRKTREMTIVGSKRMIIYDDVATLDKIRIFDARVDTPPHYDTFAEFHYAYHYGDMYVPHVKQEEPLKVECQHFLDCIKHGLRPLTDGRQALDMVRTLEASSLSLERNGAEVRLDGDGPAASQASPEVPSGATKRARGNGKPPRGSSVGGNGKPSGKGRSSEPIRASRNGKSKARAGTAGPRRCAKGKSA